MINSATSLTTKTLLIAGLGLLLMFPGQSPAADEAGIAKALEGVWSGARFDKGKGENPETGVKLELTIKDNHIKARRLPQGDIGEGDLKVSADGKTIEAVGTTGKYKDKKFLGIIKIEGNTLFWCTGVSSATERPTDFVAEQDKKTFLIVVKRQQS